MFKFIVKIAANSGAIYIASNAIDGFTFSGNILLLLAVGAALTTYQLFLHPIVKTIALPIAFLSFGLFGPLANMAILGGMAYFLPQLTIDGIVPLLLATTTLSVVNLLFSWL